MTNEQLGQKPTVTALDATTLVAVTQEILGVRRVRQAPAELFKGLDGKSAIAIITNATPANIPALGQTVQYAVDSSAGFAVDQIVAVGAASTLKVVSFPTATSIVLQNVSAATGPVATGAKIVPSGPAGPTGATGAAGPAGANGANAFTTVTNQFTIPALNSNVTATVGSTAFMSNGMSLQIGGKFFRVASVVSGTQVSLTNTLAGQTGTVAAASNVVAAGEPGPAGANGSGGGSVPVGSIYYQWSTNTAATDPTDGFIKADDVIDTATVIRVSETDVGPADRSTLLSQIAIGGIVRVQKVADGSYADFLVASNTDNGTWRAIGVTFSAGSTSAISLAANDSVVLAWLPVAGAGGGGATGLQYTYSNTAGTPTAGQIRSANLAASGTISISATDAQSQNAADVLARLKVGAIVEIAKDLANRVRGTVSSDYNSLTNNFALNQIVPYGTISNGNTVFLSIFSDAVSTPSSSVGSVYEYPLQASDPPSQAGKTLVWARSNGLLYARVSSGLIYPITFGASVPPITGGNLALLFEDLFNAPDNTAIIGRTPSTPIGANTWYTIDTNLASNGAIISNRSTSPSGSLNAGYEVGVSSYKIVVIASIPSHSSTTGFSIFVRGGAQNTPLMGWSITNNLITFNDYPSGIGVAPTVIGNAQSFSLTGDMKIVVAVDPTGTSIDITSASDSYFRYVPTTLRASNTALGYQEFGTQYAMDSFSVSTLPTGAVIGSTADNGEILYQLISGGDVGAYVCNTAVRAGTSGVLNAGWDARSTSYTLTTRYARSTGGINVWVRCGGVNSDQGFILNLYSGGIAIYEATGSSYPLVTSTTILAPETGTITISVTPTQIIFNVSGGYSYTLNSTTYASNTGVGIGSGSSNDHIIGLPVLS